MPHSLNRIEYETDFDNTNDLFESIYVLKDPIGDIENIEKQICELISIEIVEGIEIIEKELTKITSA